MSVCNLKRGMCLVPCYKQLWYYYELCCDIEIITSGIGTDIFLKFSLAVSRFSLLD
jgi:hypothetical protein